MPLTVTTDHARIVAALDRFLAADPVAATVLGTIRTTLTDAAWAAFDPERIAVRSATQWPVSITGHWPPDPRAELVPLLRALPALRGLTGPAAVVDPLVVALAPADPTTMAQALFRCDDLVPPAGVAGSARPADALVPADRDLVREWFAAFAAEAGAPSRHSRDAADQALADGRCWLWLDAADRPVSLAGQRAPVAGSARIGPVYTPPAERGHGYGSAVTATATRDVLDRGAVPVLFTDLANPTSNKIYQLLGYRRVEDRRLVTFD